MDGVDVGLLARVRRTGDRRDHRDHAECRKPFENLLDMLFPLLMTVTCQ